MHVTRIHVRESIRLVIASNASDPDAGRPQGDEGLDQHCTALYGSCRFGWQKDTQ